MIDSEMEREIQKRVDDCYVLIQQQAREEWKDAIEKAKESSKNYSDRLIEAKEEAEKALQYELGEDFRKYVGMGHDFQRILDAINSDEILKKEWEKFLFNMRMRLE